MQHQVSPNQTAKETQPRTPFSSVGSRGRTILQDICRNSCRTMLLLCLLLMSQLSVLVEVSGQNTTAWTETVDTAKADINWRLQHVWSPGARSARIQDRNQVANARQVEEKKPEPTPGTQNDEVSEVSEDEEGNAGEGSADGGVEDGGNNKDGGVEEGRNNKVGTIIIVCSVIGLVALLILVGVVLSCRKPPIERGDYTLAPGAVDDEHRVSTEAQPVSP